MIERALVFDADGRTLYWHAPPGSSAAEIPDSRALWEVLWAHRGRLGGVAHLHPDRGEPRPSWTDLTTFAACEKALGRRLAWPIVTLDAVAWFAWRGPGEHDYAATEPTVGVDELGRLCEAREEDP